MEKLKMADIYRFLAQSMKYPELSWFSDNFFVDLHNLSEELDLVDEVEKCRKLFKDSENGLWVIQTEYTRLFINAVPHVIAPPYGSVYLDESGSLYDKSTEKVADFYQRKGFNLVQKNEPPDYLIYELEFMAILADSDPDGLEEFIKDYFHPWFSIFRDKVIAETTQAYFQLVVKLIDFFTAPENED